MQFSRHHVGDTANMWKKVLCSDEIKIQKFWLNCETLCGGKLSLHITLNTPSPLSNMVVVALCSGGVSLQQGQRRWSELMGIWKEPNTGKSWKKTCESAKDLRMGLRLTFQQEYDPKHKARAKMEWSETKHIMF